MKAAVSATASLVTPCGMEKTTRSSTVWPTAMAEGLGEREVEGEGVSPGALLVLEGVGVLEAEGRLVMDSLG
jgi:hypothetical protein